MAVRGLIYFSLLCAMCVRKEGHVCWMPKKSCPILNGFRLLWQIIRRHLYPCTLISYSFQNKNIKGKLIYLCREKFQNFIMELVILSVLMGATVLLLFYVRNIFRCMPRLFLHRDKFIFSRILVVRSPFYIIAY